MADEPNNEVNNEIDKKYYLDEEGLQLYDILIKQHIESKDKVFYGTTAHWETLRDLVGKRGCIYIYSDWGESPDGKAVAGFKVGDGETRLEDLGFTDQMYNDHIQHMLIHVSAEDRANWDNKVTCFYIKDLERIIFSK